MNRDSVIVVNVIIVLLSLVETCPTIVTRKQWEAKPATFTRRLAKPVGNIVIHHTYIPKVCNVSGECREAMRNMQTYHQNEKKWTDIGYNFCIGGDGLIYEGRGWQTMGAHAPMYNSKSIGICFMGDYMKVLPSKKMLESAQDLIKCGTQKGYIDKNYTLFGHRQVTSTLCPGDALYSHIQSWSHWRDKQVSKK